MEQKRQDQGKQPQQNQTNDEKRDGGRSSDTSRVQSNTGSPQRQQQAGEQAGNQGQQESKGQGGQGER